MRSAFFFGLIVLLSIAMLYIIIPFIYPIFWAAVIAIIFYPIYLGINKHLKTPRMSSMISLILVVVVVFLPLTLISVLLVNESRDLYNRVSEGDFVSSLQNATEKLSQTSLGPYLGRAQEEWADYATSATKEISVFLFNNAKSLTQKSLTFVFMLFIMFYTLYYFFKDGPRMLKRLMYLSPLGDKYETMLYDKFTSATRATLKSTLLVGGIQGTLGGILFWIAGIDAALIWGVVMIALSIIPAVGSFIIWLPAGIVMLLLGNIWQGILILSGGLIISVIDNLLRPPLVGKDIQMHPLVVLLSTLGGLIIFGISGFIIGPIIAALFLSIISIYNFYYRNELQNN